MRLPNVKPLHCLSRELRSCRERRFHPRVWRISFFLFEEGVRRNEMVVKMGGIRREIRGHEYPSAEVMFGMADSSEKIDASMSIYFSLFW